LTYISQPNLRQRYQYFGPLFDRHICSLEYCVKTYDEFSGCGRLIFSRDVKLGAAHSLNLVKLGPGALLEHGAHRVAADQHLARRTNAIAAPVRVADGRHEIQRVHVVGDHLVVDRALRDKF